MMKISNPEKTTFRNYFYYPENPEICKTYGPSKVWDMPTVHDQETALLGSSSQLVNKTKIYRPIRSTFSTDLSVKVFVH